jgi:hypothetical protein
MKIEDQGRVIVNSSCVVHKSKNIVLLEIDFKTKHAVLFNQIRIQGLNYLAYEETEDSTNLAESYPEGHRTTICLDEYENWDIFNVNHSRYTTRVTLIKGQVHD